MAAIPVNAAVGDEFTDGKVTYIVKSDSTVGISHFDGNAPAYNFTEKVTHEGVDYKVVAVEREAFRFCEIKNIQLPQTVTYIGTQAFGSSKIQSIQLSKNTKTIENYAFYACRELKSIAIPEGVTQLGSSASGSVFGACSKLQSVTLPATLDTIWNATFYHNSSLKSIHLPNSVKYLGKNAFNSCDSLQEVTLSNGLVEISDGVFGDCKMLSQIKNIPANLAHIGVDAFFNCPITEFTIPASCTTIGERAFSGTKIKEFILYPDNKAYTMIGKSVYTADKKVLMFYPPCAEDKVATVADGCIGINAGAFMGAQIDKVVIPASVAAINDFAFCFSTVSDVQMTDNVIYIGEQAFAASGLKSIVLPAGIGQLSTATFAGCEALESVTIPSNVKLMGIRQFWNCKNLKEVHFLGYHSPEVDYWEYASEAPFFGIDAKSVTISCPKGRTANYEENYGSYEEIAAIKDTEAGVIIPSLITPNDNAEVSVLDKLTFNFSEEVTVVNSNPAINVVCGEIIGNAPIGKDYPVGMWVMNKKSAQEFYAVPLDEYGEGGNPINMEKGKTYFATLPAGVFKNAEGLLNEAVTVKYNGVWEKPVLNFTKVVPADGSTLENIDNIFITFNEVPHKSHDAESKIKLIEGTLVDGVPTGTPTMGTADQWVVNVRNKTVQIFPADLDWYTCPIKLDANKEYFLVVEAKAFFNNDAFNNDIVIKYGGVVTGIEEAVKSDFYLVKKAGCLEVHLANDSVASIQIYNAAGQLVSSENNVSGTVLFGNLNKGVYVVKVVSAQGSKSVKVLM